MTKRRHVIAVSAAACLTAATLTAAGAASAGPAGTGRVDTGRVDAGKAVAVSSLQSTGYAKDYYLQAASTTWVVFTVRSTAYGTKNGSIRRLDLATKKFVLVAGPTKSSAEKTPRRVVEWGDYVAWDYSSGKGTYSSFLRNARTMSPRVALPSLDFVVGASAGGVTLRVAGSKPMPTLLRSWTSDSTRTVYSGTAFIASSVAAYTKNAGDSNSPGEGTVYARPLAHAVDRPRSLGNPFAAAGVHKGHTWRFDLPTSAALTSCTVSIRRHGHLVRTLSCAGELMRLGEVSVAWNGTDTAGHRVARGSYHVLVSASNADGSLLAANGLHAATGATVTVR